MWLLVLQQQTHWVMSEEVGNNLSVNKINFANRLFSGM